MPPRIAYSLNVLALYGLSGVLLVAFYSQFVGGELPCPLCILQRAGFVIVGMGLVFNVWRGPLPQQYGLMLLGAVAGGAVALRQLALHVVPGTGTYGPPLFGLHFYTWAFIAFVAVIVGAALMLVFFREGYEGVRRGALANLAIALFIGVTLANGLSTLAECGTSLCPDNPTSYEGYETLKVWLGRNGIDVGR